MRVRLATFLLEVNGLRPAIGCKRFLVGADAAADLVAVGALDAGEPFMLIDIGTNSEVVAGDGRRVVAASSPESR